MNVTVNKTHPFAETWAAPLKIERFHGGITIRSHIGKNVNIELAVYNHSGQKIEVNTNTKRVSGRTVVTWAFRETLSECYLLTVKTGTYAKSSKVVIDYLFSSGVKNK